MSSFSELAAQIPEGISASLSGIPWWTTDIGGFGCPTSPHNNSSPYMQQLVMRWYQFGALCPVMRTHGCRAGLASPPPPEHPLPAECSVGQGPGGSCGSNELWSFGGKDVEAVLLRYVRLRRYLQPYLAELAWNVTRDGVVTMRSLAYEFPTDPAAVGIQDQFLLGPDFLVAPVYVENATWRSVYLPTVRGDGGRNSSSSSSDPGDHNGPQEQVTGWIDFWNPTLVIYGGQHMNLSAPYWKLPLYVRRRASGSMAEQLAWGEFRRRQKEGPGK